MLQLILWNVLIKQTENTRFFLWYNLLLLSNSQKQQNFASHAAKNKEIWSKTKSMNKFYIDLHSQNKNIEKNEKITIKMRLKHWNSFFAIWKYSRMICFCIISLVFVQFKARSLSFAIGLLIMRILFDIFNIFHVIYKMYCSFEVLHTI
jgi:hypothetical protein